MSCPRPSGRLHGGKLGPIALGMTTKQAETLLRRFGPGPFRFVNFCLYAGFGIRAATPSAKLLRSLSPRLRSKVKNRFVIALTPNRFYALSGVRPGSKLAPVAKRLHVGKPFQIGVNTWYIVPGSDNPAGVIKVRRGLIYEVGIADARLLKGRAAQRLFLSSFAS